MKTSIFRGVHENLIHRGCLKSALGQFTDLIGGQGVVDTPMHTMLANLKTTFVN